MQSFESAKRWLKKLVKIILTYVNYESSSNNVKNKTLLRLGVQSLLFLFLVGIYVA